MTLPQTASSSFSTAATAVASSSYGFHSILATTVLDPLTVLKAKGKGKAKARGNGNGNTNTNANTDGGAATNANCLNPISYYLVYTFPPLAFLDPYELGSTFTTSDALSSGGVAVDYRHWPSSWSFSSDDGGGNVNDNNNNDGWDSVGSRRHKVVDLESPLADGVASSSFLLVNFSMGGGVLDSSFRERSSSSLSFSFATTTDEEGDANANADAGGDGDGDGDTPTETDPLTVGIINTLAKTKTKTKTRTINVPFHIRYGPLSPSAVGENTHASVVVQPPLAFLECSGREEEGDAAFVKALPAPVASLFPAEDEDGLGRYLVPIALPKMTSMTTTAGVRSEVEQAGVVVSVPVGISSHLGLVESGTAGVVLVCFVWVGWKALKVAKRLGKRRGGGLKME